MADFIKRRKHEIEFIILITALFLIWYLGRYFHIDAQAIQRLLQSLPLNLSVVIYILLYVIITFFIFFSKDLFWLMGALIFGPALSAIFIFIAEVINAFILFFLARKLGRVYIDKSLSEKYKKLDEKLADVSFFWLFTFRAAPLIPYRFLDLAAGLTKINFKKYLAAVIFGSPLKIFWIQYILTGVGKNVFNPYLLAQYFLNNKTLFLFSLIYIILVILVILKIRGKD
jgi:uncharacterized membrane protein YdjX (TVP38/TMEM64 family)